MAACQDSKLAITQVILQSMSIASYGWFDTFSWRKEGVTCLQGNLKGGFQLLWLADGIASPLGLVHHQHAPCIPACTTMLAVGIIIDWMPSVTHATVATGILHSDLTAMGRRHMLPEGCAAS